MRYRVLAVAVAAVSLLGCGSANLSSTNTTDLFQDSPIYTETLDNGLQVYFIKRQEAGLAVELLVDVGAKDETEGQEGMAHFVEHMMFQGTQRYSRSELAATYQQVGLALGPDVNAFTSTDDTLYKINLPGRVMDTQAPQNLMLWLADVIHGDALMSEQEVALERGVILAERAGRQQDSRDFVMQEQRHWLASAADYADALGDKTVIQQVSATQLTQFYQQHYRADNATLFVSSDQPEQWLQTVRAEFGQVSKAKPVINKDVAEVKPNKSFHRSVPTTDLLWQSDKMTPFTRLSLQILDKPRVTQSDWQAWHFADLTQELLQLRLKAARQYADFALTDVDVHFRPLQGHLLLQVDLVHGVGEHAQAVSWLESELYRITQLGLTQVEAEVYRTRLQNLDDSSQPCQCLNTLRSRLRYLSAAEREASYQGTIVWGDGSKTYLEAEFNKQLQGKKTWAFVGQQLDKTQLEQAKVAALTLPLRPLAELDLDQPIPGPYYPKGQILERTHLDDIGVDKLQLSNGVTVYVKTESSKEDRVYMYLVAKGGVGALAPNDRAASQHLVNVMAQGGLNWISAGDFEQYLRSEGMTVLPVFNEIVQGLYWEGSALQADTGLALLHSLMQDVQVNEQLLDATLNNAAVQLKQYETTARADFVAQVTRARAGEDVYEAPVTRSEVMKLNAEQFSRLYQNLYGNLAGYSLVIVGPVSANYLTDALQTSIASLPAGDASRRQWQARQPWQGTQEDVVVAGWDKDKALASWVLSKPRTNDFSERDAIMDHVLVNLLYRRFNESIREQQGASYALEIYNQRLRIPNTQQWLEVKSMIDPNQVATFKASLQGVYEDLQTTAFSQTELAQVKELVSPYYQTAEQGLKNQASYLVDYAVLNEQLLLLSEGAATVDALTLAEVNAAWQDWLQRGQTQWAVLTP